MTFDPSEIVLDVKGNQILSIYLILLVVQGNQTLRQTTIHDFYKITNFCRHKTGINVLKSLYFASCRTISLTQM